MRQFIKKYSLLLISIGFFFAFLYAYFYYIKGNSKSEINNFKEIFVSKEKQLDAFLLEKQKELSINKDLNFETKNEAFYFHLYKNDSLIYWNSNQLPILRFAEIHYPSSGLVKLQNGWYYAKTFKEGNYIGIASFLIKHEFAIENDLLKSNFNPDFNLVHHFEISLEKSTNYDVLDKNNAFIFSLKKQKQSFFNKKADQIIIFFFICSIFFFLFFISYASKFLSVTNHFILSSFIVFGHFIALRIGVYDFFSFSNYTDTSIFALSNWYPNLLVFCINTLVLSFFIFQLIRFIHYKKLNIWILTILLIFAFIYFYYQNYLLKQIVFNSSIPFELEQLFQLNLYTFWVLISFGFLFTSFIRFIQVLILKLVKEPQQKNKFFVISIVLGLCFVIFYLFDLPNLTFLFAILISLAYYFILVRNKKPGFIFNSLILFLFSFYISFSIYKLLQEKNKDDQLFLAQELSSDRNISTELELLNLESKIKKDLYFTKFNNKSISQKEVNNTISRKYLPGFLERYDVDFLLINSLKNDSVSSENLSQLNELHQIIQNHSETSELSNNIFYVKDYTSQLNYIQKIKIDSSLILYASFKSKKIPERIGFPRLLISKKSNIIDKIENYSFAKYYRHQLINHYGKFTYPIYDYDFNRFKKKTQHFQTDKHNHIIVRKSNDDLIVLSSSKKDNYTFFTSSSYLFCFFGIFVFLPSFLRFKGKFSLKEMTLSLKIQLVLISIIIVSLLFFGFGNGIYIQKQYTDITNELIKEKLNSVTYELQSKLKKYRHLTIEQHGAFLETILKKFGKVFVTDINLYDANGYMLSTSQSKVYNLGLLSEQINPIAFKELSLSKNSLFIHHENIGELNYISAYKPLMNEKNKFLAYLNLQHFGQQQGLQKQIESFLIAIINVFVLLLALSIVLSVIITNWVLNPLKVIQNNLKQVQLGKYNQPIAYQAKDEIGLLVENYNKKIVELELTAKLLAQSERESAWKEMAKQVAHEIKNPLTPMKLSLQHLQRLHELNDPSLKDKFNDLISSVVQQINNLTQIANEFSNMAKMPDENKKEIDFLPFLIATINLYKNHENVLLSINSEIESMFILADKELLIRVFNNLITNAIQACSEKTNALIEIQIKKEEGNYLISVKDNGKGIAEQEKKHIFEPYFTTKSSGTGLGLAIVKQIIVSHQGDVWFETQKGNGTTFYVSFPVIQVNN